LKGLTLALAFLLPAGLGHAQTMRPFGTFRQLHGETRLSTRLDYAAGSLAVAPGRPGELYRMDLSYDESRFLPVSDFDPSKSSVVLGIRTAEGVRLVSPTQLRQVAAVSISPRVDLTLDLSLGAADADVELGGLRIADLALKTGASRTVVRFSQPNAIRCRRAAITAGAADVSVLGLGNSRCQEIEFQAGVGKTVLDFAGTWTSSTRLAVRMAVGELTLRLPRQAGVRITMDKFLASFKPAGLLRREDGFESSNYRRQQRRLDIHLTTAVGGVNVEWAE
jgi:Cell wall-active antibiotics response 4TMS YvqF